jgi:uncharacterized protein
MKNKIKELERKLEVIYKEKSRDLLFHGWHHITFVRKKALDFSKELKADPFLVEAAALTHDLNYIAKKNSSPKEGESLRISFLEKSRFTKEEIEKINKIIIEENIRTRDENISREAKALSDADTLFKALPITPIIFAQKYISENDVNISKLAKKILEEQKPLLEKGIYFYSESAKKKYSAWARGNIQLWKNVNEALEDKDITEMLKIAENLGAI